MSRLIVGELTLDRAREALDGELVDIVYSDPPWGPGNLMYWRTHNNEIERPSWPDFLATFCEVVALSTRDHAHIFVEMGLRWVDELSRCMESFGHPETRRSVCYYGPAKNRLPNVLWYSGPGSTTDPAGMHGVAMTKHALAGVARPGAVVFDPCCGKGMTARCAIRLGMRFAGVELNPKRVAVTQAFLDRHDRTRAR